LYVCGVYFSCGKIKVCDELKREAIGGKVRRYIAGGRPQATLPRSQSSRLQDGLRKQKQQSDNNAVRGLDAVTSN
jgi:hypothetical protein